MGAHGGARTGAGRKPKAEKFGISIDEAERKIADGLPELVDLQFKRARGVLALDLDGEVYQQPPDRQAIEYLINRIMGKPVERTEQAHEGGLTIRILYADNDEKPFDIGHDRPDAPEAACRTEEDPRVEG